jgi:hypothetical protein
MRTRQVFLLAPAKHGVRSLALGVLWFGFPAKFRLSRRLLDMYVLHFTVLLRTFCHPIARYEDSSFHFDADRYPDPVFHIIGAGSKFSVFTFMLVRSRILFLMKVVLMKEKKLHLDVPLKNHSTRRHKMFQEIIFP